MDPNVDWHRVYRLFTELLDTPEPDRAARLDELCGNDAALKKAVQTALLQADSPSTELGFEKPIHQLMQQMASDSKTFVPSRTGQKVGHYYVQKLIGRGGQGDVYRAWDEQLERPVALKFLSNRRPISEQVLQQFQQEARAIASVEDEHICRLYSIDTTDDDTPFMVMEFVDGITLAEKIERDRPIAPEKALDIVTQISIGLQAAHDKKLIHQDIKPSNILLSGPSETVKITDFGVARWRRLQSLPGTGGTIPYMSPEQLIGDDVDYRTDIWSLGVVLYETLSGTNPLRIPGLTPDATYDIISSGVAFPALPDASPEVQDILDSCLQKEREARCRSASELRRRLERPRAGKSFPQRTILVAGIVLIAVILTAYLFWGPANRPSPPEASTGVTAVMWTEAEADPYAQEWIAFQLESMLTRLQQHATETHSQLVLIEPVRGVTDPEHAFVRYGAERIIQLSIFPVDGRNLLRMRQLESANAGIVYANSLPLTELNYSTSHQLLIKLLEHLDIQLNDRELYLVLYNSAANPEAIRRFESAQAMLERAGGMRDVDTAIGLLTSSIEIDSSFALSYAWLAQAYFQRYDFYESADDLENARLADRQAQARDPYHILRYPNFVSQGLLYQATGRYDDAIDAFEMAIALDSSQSVAYVGAAEVLARENRKQLAESYFHKALSLNRDNTEVLVALGVFKFDQAEYDSAAYYFNRIIQLDPFYKAAHRNLGASYEKLDRLDEAESSYARALAIEPDYLTYHNLAVMYYNIADFAKAIDSWKEAIELNSDIDALWGGLGYAYGKAYPDSSAAREIAFRRAIALAESLLVQNPRDVYALLALSDYYLQLQDSASSRYFLQRAGDFPIPPDKQPDFESLSASLDR